jgi:hypothetical protein
MESGITPGAIGMESVVDIVVIVSDTSSPTVMILSSVPFFFLPNRPKLAFLTPVFTDDRRPFVADVVKLVAAFVADNPTLVAEEAAFVADCPAVLAKLAAFLTPAAIFLA